MSVELSTLGINVRWELTRLRRSRRVWLLLIPPVAGPIGSAIADLYLRVPSPGTAAVLGLLITGGLGALIVLDLTALAVGEDLGLRAQYLTFALPQGRAASLAGRLAVVLGGGIALYGVGAATIVGLADAIVQPTLAGPAPLLIPSHLAVGIVGLLLFLGGITAAAAVVTRSASQALVAGVLAGVLAAGLGSLFLLEGRLTSLFPEAMAAVGVAGIVWCLWRYAQLEA